MKNFIQSTMLQHDLKQNFNFWKPSTLSELLSAIIKSVRDIKWGMEQTVSEVEKKQTKTWENFVRSQICSDNRHWKLLYAFRQNKAELTGASTLCTEQLHDMLLRHDPTWEKKLEGNSNYCEENVFFLIHKQAQHQQYSEFKNHHHYDKRNIQHLIRPRHQNEHFSLTACIVCVSAVSSWSKFIYLFSEDRVINFLWWQPQTSCK